MVKVNSGCEYSPTLTFSTRIVTAQFRCDGGLGWAREIAVTLPVSASFFAEGAADAPVISGVVKQAAMAAKMVARPMRCDESTWARFCLPNIDLPLAKV